MSFVSQGTEAPYFNARADLKQYMRALMVTLLTRMQTSKTDKYVYHFVHFLLFTAAINVEGLTPDFIIDAVEEIQPKSVISQLELHVH